MVMMINVSTKTGDSGQSSLADGQRLTKDQAVFAAIGDLDELNSWLGLLVIKLGPTFKQQKKFLLYLQEKLFVVGAELAQASKTKTNAYLLKKIEHQSQQLQQSMSKNWHKKFLLPGGTEVGAYLDIARTVTRRWERSLVALADSPQNFEQSTKSTKDIKYKVRPLVLKIANRLSDYLYVLRCFVNWRLQYQEKKFVKRCGK